MTKQEAINVLENITGWGIKHPLLNNIIYKNMYGELKSILNENSDSILLNENSFWNNKTIELYDTGWEYERVFEMARINDPKQLKYDVIVNGGGPGSGQMEHEEPHFHFSDNYEGPGKFSFSIKIPTKLEWNFSHELIITDPKRGSWNGLRKEKEELIKWLDMKNKKDPKNTNLEVIRIFWNILNEENPNVKQVE